MSLGHAVTCAAPQVRISRAATAEGKETQPMNAAKTINGFQCEDLQQLRKSLRSNPGNAQFKLRAKNRWIDGAQCISLVSNFNGLGRAFSARNVPFIQTTDTPEILAGKDLGQPRWRNCSSLSRLGDNDTGVPCQRSELDCPRNRMRD